MITWESPQWGLPAAAMTAVSLIALVWGYRRVPAARGMCAGALKLLGVAILAVCLIEPYLNGTRPIPGANLIVVLADASQSLEIRDPGAAKSRAEVLNDRLAANAAWYTKLSQDFDVRRYSFAERVRPLKETDRVEATGAATSLMAGLTTIARRFRGRPLAGVLVLTDGNATDLSSTEPDWSSLPPVYSVPIGEEAPPRDISIHNVAVSQTSFEQAPVTVRATVAAGGYEDERVVVRLNDESGARLQEQTIQVSDEKQPRVVRFKLKPEGRDVTFYQVHAAAESVHAAAESVRAAEATEANNIALVTVDRTGGPFRVLYVAGRPNWEFKFLKRALIEDAEVGLTGLIRIATREPKFTFMGRGESSANPLFKGFKEGRDEETERYDEPVLLRIDTRDDKELRGGFPKAADELFQYDAVIVDDLEAAFFTQDQMALVEKFASQRGGGFLMLGGAESFAQGAYRRTPIGDMLPVYLDRRPSDASRGRYRLALSREGWLQPWVRLRGTEEEERQRLETLPAFATLNRVRGIKPGASVLAYAIGELQEEDRYPALVVQRFGRGRTAALLIGDLWRWTLKRTFGEENELARAWRQIVRWLVADVPRRIELDARRELGDPGMPVAVRVRVRDPEYKPLDNAAVELTITPPDGKELKLSADAGDSEAGLYVAKYVPRQPGVYRVHAAVTAADGSAVGDATAGWTAQPAADEFRRLAPNRDLLARIARETGGEVIPMDGLDRFVADLPTREVPSMEPWAHPLWHHTAVFLLVFLCLTAEWGLRRWKGLP